MISRRDFLQVGMAASAIVGSSGFGNWSRLAAQQTLTQDQLLDFPTTGNVTLIHITDIHAQMKPVWFREPEINLGVGAVQGLPPHVTGADFLKLYGIEPGSAAQYALTYPDFVALANAYGKVGGLDRCATIIRSIRAERPEALLLDGGDTWQGSLTALRTEGQDMVNVMNALGVDAMTSHWEFTLGIDRVNQIVENELAFPFLGANIFDTEWEERVYEPYRIFERGGSKIAVIGQAFPYLPIANPSWMFPGLSFGVRQDNMAELVAEVREAGADVVVLLSHNGFDVDRKLAGDVPGIDVILTGHTHDALPEPVQVGKTLLIASGSQGKFISRVDLDVQGGEVRDVAYKLIPVFSDVIAPDPEVAALIDAEREPYLDELTEVVGATDSLLYRRGNFNGTWDDVICQALIEEREADIALSPGLPLGDEPRAGCRNHPRGHLQRDRHELSRSLPLGNDRRDVAPHSRGCGGQPLQPRSVLPAGWRHGPGGGHGLPHRCRQASRVADHGNDAALDRGGDRPGAQLHGGRMGQRERGDRGTADLGRRGNLYQAQGYDQRDAEHERHSRCGLRARSNREWMRWQAKDYFRIHRAADS